ncbi:hypothetical protein LTR22_028323, partial [Elasticomyces elasticus]
MSAEVDVTKMLAECTLLSSDPDAVQELISDERFDEDTVSAINELFKADSTVDVLAVLTMMQDIVVEIVAWGTVLVVWPPHSR